MPQLPPGVEPLDEQNTKLPLGVEPIGSSSPIKATPAKVTNDQPRGFKQYQSPTGRVPSTSLSDEPSQPGFLERLNSSLESIANPQSIGDFGNLLIPAGVDQAIKYGVKAYKNYKSLPVKPPVNPAVIQEALKPAGDISLPPEIRKLPPDSVDPRNIPVGQKIAPNTTNTWDEIELARDKRGTNRIGGFADRTAVPGHGEEISTKFPNEPDLLLNQVNQADNALAVPLTARDKLKLQFDEIASTRNKQESIYTAERGKRISEALSSDKSGEPWARDYMSALKGEYEKVPFNGIKLEQPDVDELFDAIKKSGKLTNWERPRAITGLNKILQGSEVPQENELKVLRRVLGIDFRRDMTPIGLVQEAVNFPKAIQAAYDLSAPFRQALPVINRKEWWTSWDDMIKSAGSQKFFDNLQESFREKPHFELGQKSKLHLSDVGTIAGREEQFLSNFANLIPGIKASNRAYTGFLNKLRSDLFNRLIDNSIKAGKDPYKDLRIAQDLASFVNVATGRGSLGSAEKWADGLNTILFSPRFIASRVQLVANPVAYVKMPWEVRKEYLKSLLAIAETGAAVSVAAKMAGGDVDTHPTSSDFGKVKFGNTRIDPYGGFQQYLTLFNRLVMGESTPSSGSNVNKPYELGSKFGLNTRKDVVVDFFSNKLAPVPRFINGWLDQTKKRGFNIPEESIRMFTPMIAQDLYDVSQEDPELLPITVPLSGVGFGVQSYE